METDQAQCLILQAGEQILCQACRVPLADISTDCFGTLTLDSVHPTPEGLRIATLCCRICKPHGGALPTKNPRRAWFLKVCHAPRLLVRSGSWIGWRELGGE